MIMTMAMRSVGQLVGRDSDELDEFFSFSFFVLARSLVRGLPYLPKVPYFM